MFYILKLLSYSPIFNVVGSDKNFGDLYKSSDSIRFSLFAFTLVNFYSFFSLTYFKESREYKFELIKIISYPIHKENINSEELIDSFKNEIKDLDADSLKIKLEVLQYRIDSQNEAINTSIAKAGIVLPIFIAIFIYILQTKIINLEISNYSIIALFILAIILFCYLATSTNLLYFLMKLSKVSSFAEVSLLKSKSSLELLQEKSVEVYSKFIQNRNRSVNRVSYNIWVQDYFKKFLLYASILYLFAYLSPDESIEKKSEATILPLTSCHAILFKKGSTKLENSQILTEIKKELLEKENKNLIYLVKSDSLNLVRIESLEGFVSLHINTNEIDSRVIFSSEIKDSNRIYLIIDEAIK